MKKILFIFMFLLLPTDVFANDGVTGFWTTVDDETKEPKSVVQIYEY